MTMAQLREAFVKKRDVWVSRQIYSRFSIPTVWALLRTRVTPNEVTWASAVIGLLGASAIGWNRDLATLAAGWILLQASFVLDHVDGQLARATKSGSQGGMFLDEFAMEILIHMALSFALPISVYFATGDRLWIWIAAAFLLVKAVNLGTYQAKRALTLRAPVARDSTYRDPLKRRPAHVLFFERYWEVKKMGNLAMALMALDLVLKLNSFQITTVRGHDVPLLGAFILIGIPVLVLTTAVDAYRASKGRYYVDLNPYG